MEHDKTWYPNTCGSKFNLTCKKEFAELAQFKEMKKAANTVVQECKNKLRAIIYDKEKMEEKELTKTLHITVIKRLCSIFEIYTCAVRDENPDLTPPYDDKRAGEMMTMHFFYQQRICRRKHANLPPDQRQGSVNEENLFT